MLDLIVLHGEFSLFTVRGNFWYSSASLVRASVVRGTSVVRGFKRQIFSSHFYF